MLISALHDVIMTVSRQWTQS